MGLRDTPVTKWSPTADDPLNGCRDKTRRLYAVIVAEPGIRQKEAFTRAGFGDGSSVGVLVDRDLIEVRQDEHFNNYLWPLERRA